MDRERKRSDDAPAGPTSTIPAHGPIDPEAVAAPRLEIVVEREGGAPCSRRSEIVGDLVRIGAHPSNELILKDRRVSRFHCRLVQRARAWHVVDEGSLNGTRVGGLRVTDAELPLPECHVELGDSKLRVRPLGDGVVRLPSHEAFGSLQGRSAAMRQLFATLESVAQSDANVLIEGESGTGKELVAAEIVQRGPRADKPFVIIDCGAIVPTLVEGSLFGHVRGAFTGADRERPGAFEAAEGGTVFLDEIGEMPLDMQPKLLRVLESRTVSRLGETRKRKVDVRVIAATNRRLELEVNHGRFREDLFFRLSVVTVRVPPLRERTEDLGLLVSAMLESLGAQRARGLFTPEVLARMAQHDWPGNVRELRNAVERATVLNSLTPPLAGPAEEIEPSIDEPPGHANDVDLDVPLKTAKERLVAEFERRYVSALLVWSGGNVARAARRAGMDRINMHRVIQKHGLRAPRSMKEE
jgi:transcriptional regulator with GAF, ATPase, and Fis domain